MDLGSEVVVGRVYGRSGGVDGEVDAVWCDSVGRSDMCAYLLSVEYGAWLLFVTGVYVGGVSTALFGELLDP